VKDANVDLRGSVEESGSVSPSLLVRLRANEPAAWERLTALFGPTVYGWCRRAGLRAEDAADVGQEVFRAVARTLARFHRERPGDTFRGWLWRIVQNKLRDHWRRQKAGPEAAGGTSAQQRLHDLPDEAAPSSTGPAADAESAALFRRGLDLIRTEFTDRTWQAFWEVAVDDRDPADVAARLGMTPGAVYIAKSRVLRRLREELSEVLE
jgi:RNA polymerase sigma-70 factor (ECF subfamily)